MPENSLHVPLREAKFGRPRLFQFAAITAAALAFVSLSHKATARPACPPVVEEAVEDVESGGLPTDRVRWQVAEKIWRSASPRTKSDVTEMLAGGGLVPASDVIQGRTQDLLREAIANGHSALADDLISLWMMPFEKLTYRDSIEAYYVDPGKRISTVKLSRPHPMWVGSDGMETVLYAAIYLGGATDVLKTIAGLPPERRSKRMTEFAARIADLASDHFLRWAFGPKIWQVHGWGCAAGDLNLVDFTQQRLNGTLGNGAETYCRAPTDLDMLIALGIVNLLAASTLSPELSRLDPGDQHRLSALLRLQVSFLGSRFVGDTAQGPDGRSVATSDFDPGSWDTYPDMAYASDETMTLPTSKPPPKQGVGWDFSHGARIAWFIITFAEHPEIVGNEFNWSDIRASFARQVAYRVLDGIPDLPRFRNYLDGSNGWYRVNYSGRQQSGTPPYGMSRSYFSMPWARLTPYDPKMAQVALGAWKLLTGATSAHCALLREIYVDGSYWANGKPYPMALRDDSKDLELLTFLATTPVR